MAFVWWEMIKQNKKLLMKVFQWWQHNYFLLLFKELKEHQSYGYVNVHLLNSSTSLIIIGGKCRTVRCSNYLVHEVLKTNMSNLVCKLSLWLRVLVNSSTLEEGCSNTNSMHWFMQPNYWSLHQQTRFLLNRG